MSSSIKLIPGLVAYWHLKNCCSNEFKKCCGGQVSSNLAVSLYADWERSTKLCCPLDYECLPGNSCREKEPLQCSVKGEDCKVFSCCPGYVCCSGPECRPREEGLCKCPSSGCPPLSPACRGLLHTCDKPSDCCSGSCFSLGSLLGLCLPWWEWIKLLAEFRPDVSILTPFPSLHMDWKIQQSGRSVED